jgi:hypothetical protein
MRVFLAALALLACLGAVPAPSDGAKAKALLHDTPANVAELVLSQIGCAKPLNFEPESPRPELFGCNFGGPSITINAVASMGCDMNKHPETASPMLTYLIAAGLLLIKNGPDAVREWINDFI